jgi:hypothetical protein
MCRCPGKYRKCLALSVLIVLLISCNISYSQSFSKEAGVNEIPQRSIAEILEKMESFTSDSLSGYSLLRPPDLHPARNELFYDTLKVRASKNRFTRQIYDFVVVNPDTVYRKEFSGTSDASYTMFEGKKIRKIEIRRLNVFGMDIDYPLSDNSKKYEKILNKTHFNTNEKIIRKNLLFSEGDLISPLAISDNERLLRQLPFINDARITVVQVSDEEADIIVFTKDVYSLGGSFTWRGIDKGSVSVFDKNIFGIGHELGIDVPYDSDKPNSPGFGVHYVIDNIGKSFINMNAFYLNGLGQKTYGIDLSRKLISSTTKYAGGISIHQMYTTDDLDTLLVPVPLKYNLQDYWISRSFLVNSFSVTRITIGARYINNNVFEHPDIFPDSYHRLQRYRVYMASAALSVQKYTKTHLLYNYGTTEDVPYGGLLNFTAGKEYNEFKTREYFGVEGSYGNKSRALGYFYLYAGYSLYLNNSNTEQGLLSLRLNYFSNLLNVRRSRLRNFVQFQYTRGIGRYTDEYLRFNNDFGFSGFKNDSISGRQRLTVNLESVLFSRLNLVGFKFAFFGFTDLSYLSGSNEILGKGYSLSSIGLGFRVRNDNLIFNTLQVRIAYFPNPPPLSRISGVTVSGEQLLPPQNFDPGPPRVVPYR